jgi:bacillopeptidase F (M6 metalloprotease family)
MAEPRPEKKRQEAPGRPAEQRVLAMQLQVGDRLVDETGTWEVASRPYMTNAAGEDAHVRVKKVGQPEVTEIRFWSAHERVSVWRLCSSSNVWRDFCATIADGTARGQNPRWNEPRLTKKEKAG